jgi:hypothetical protein
MGVDMCGHGTKRKRLLLLVGLVSGLMSSTGCYVTDPFGNVVGKGPLFRFGEALVEHGHRAGASGCAACQGCGETYIDEWYNHPPKTGPKKGWWGYAYQGAGCDGPGCEAVCGSEMIDSHVEPGCGYESLTGTQACPHCGGGMMSTEAVESASESIPLEPVPDQSTGKVSPARTRKIFRQRVPAAHP